MRTIVLANHKGGSGKTVSTANLGGALASLGMRTLLVDLDSQAQLATAVGAQDLLQYNEEDGTIMSPTVADLLDPRGRDRTSIADVVIETGFENLHLLPASHEIEEARRSLETNPTAGLNAIKKHLSPENLRAHGLEYDWVVIDTAPKLDIILDNALIAANYVIAVLGPEPQQAEPMARFVGRVQAVRENIAPDLQLLGVLFNKANHAWASTSSIPERLERMGMPVFETVIPNYATLANSYGQGPVVFTAPNSRAAGLVRTFALEVLTRITENSESEG